MVVEGVIPTGAVFQAEGGISREPTITLRARSLGPLEKTRAFGMTPVSHSEQKRVSFTEATGNLFHLATH